MHMQALIKRRAAILCLALTLSAYCYAQNLTIGNDLPCGDDNLSCVADDQCYLRTELCDGVGFCATFGEDEGGAIINALDCTGAFGPAERYRCNAGTQVLTLDLLCDGTADCVPGGDDETNALCANKCRLPFYGGCSFTRQCATSSLSVNCGDCLSGLVDIGQDDCVLLECPDPPEIMNGMRTFTGNLLGDTATYTCDPGFELMGDEMTTCTQVSAAAEFSPEPPECIPLCSFPLDPDNGMGTCTGNSLGDTCTFTCDPGFEPFGPTTITCTQLDPNSADFEPSPPECRSPPVLDVGDDPHFSIALPSGKLLCYTVQGEHGFTFNLISNKRLHMNAMFVPDSRREEVTWLGSMGIIIHSSSYKRSNGTALRFEAKVNTIHIGDKIMLKARNIEKLTFSDGKLAISEAPPVEGFKYPAVYVDLQDVGLSFSIKFMNEHLDLFWHSTGQVITDSHGIIGQFFRKGVEIDEVRKILIMPNKEPVPVMRRPVWSFMEREVADDQLCWTAMNPGYQGDGLIDGKYFDYLVNDVLTADFKFQKQQ